jgi:hypothetical protein
VNFSLVFCSDSDFSFIRPCDLCHHRIVSLGLAKEQFAGTPSSKTRRKWRSGKQARRARWLRKHQFLPDFSAFLEHLADSSGNLLIVGDFNIHVDVSSDPLVKKFNSISKMHRLRQHVLSSTHLGGHILDLVLSRESDNFVADCFVKGVISDHLAVNSVLRARRPIRPQRIITFRRLKSIETEAFRADLLSLPLINDPADDVDSLLTQYNTGLVCELEKNAPLLKKLVTIRPDNPWETDEIRDARRFSRKMERRWRSRGLVIDKECYLSSRDNLKQLISAEKVRFLNSKIYCRGRKSFFKIVDTFLLKKPGHKLPHHVTLDEIVERFSEFFVQKIENIRAGLEAARPPCQPDQHTQAGALTSFASVSVADVSSLLKSCRVKSLLRDPIPTFGS